MEGETELEGLEETEEETEVEGETELEGELDTDEDTEDDTELETEEDAEPAPPVAGANEIATCSTLANPGVQDVE